MTPNPDTASEDATREAVEGFGDWTEDDLDPDEGDSGSATRGGSGGTFLTDLDDTLRGAGLTVKEQDGWKGRGNSKGGYEGRPIGIIIHHTNGKKAADGQGDVSWILTNPKARPMANLYLDRKGTWWVLAAGRTNTNGRGGPWGPIPYYGANNRVIGIEGGNRGNNEESWPEVMQDSFVKGVAALADRYGIDGSNILSHYEWRRADNRPDKNWDKVDPAGPSRFGSINRQGTWDMNKFRAAVNEARKNRSNVKAVHTTSADDDDMYVVQPGDAWWSIAEKTMGNAKATWESLAAANGGEKRVLIAGQVLTIPGATGQSAQSAAKAAPGAYPGEAKRGMTGPIVLAWQEALIAHRVIADNEDNRDGDYGEGMEKAVLKLQQSWDWSDADGIAGSGTWKKLQS